MEDKKYELAPETVTEFYSKSMYRIRALKDFSDVKKGDLGGYVESEENLSQEGNCWIYDASIVGLGGKVIDNAVVRGFSSVINGSEISDDAIVEKSSVIDEYSAVSDQSRVTKTVMVGGSAVLFKSVVNSGSVLEEGSIVCNATVGPNVNISNGADISFDVSSDEDYVVYKAPMSYGRSLTASTKKDIWSCSPLVNTAENVRTYISDDELLEEGDEYLRWYDSIVAFHKNYFNIK